VTACPSASGHTIRRAIAPEICRTANRRGESSGVSKPIHIDSFRSALAGFIGRHAAVGAEVWIVDPDRGNRPAFNRQMAALGFRLSEERLDRNAAPGAAAFKGRLLTYRTRQVLQ
jgi:hypothetical protein